MSRSLGQDKLSSSKLSLEERFQRLRSTTKQPLSTGQSPAPGSPSISSPASRPTSPTRKPLLGPRDPPPQLYHSSPSSLANLPSSLIPETPSRGIILPSSPQSFFESKSNVQTDSYRSQFAIPNSSVRHSSNSVNLSSDAGYAHSSGSLPSAGPLPFSLARKPVGEPPRQKSEINGVPSYPRADTAISVKSREYKYPRTSMVTAETLANYIVDTPEVILLLDIRSREAFDQGHIYSKNVVCIEPFILRNR